LGQQKFIEAASVEHCQEDWRGLFSQQLFTGEVVEAMRQVSRADIPKTPDKIAATALYFGVPVISRDGRIRSSSVQTVW
jgi:hypothetical protein